MAWLVVLLVYRGFTYVVVHVGSGLGRSVGRAEGLTEPREQLKVMERHQSGTGVEAGAWLCHHRLTRSSEVADARA